MQPSTHSIDQVRGRALEAARPQHVASNEHDQNDDTGPATLVMLAAALDAVAGARLIGRGGAGDAQGIWRGPIRASLVYLTIP